MKSPIFIFSMPRSGSTLMQRVLLSHKDIASVAEPWLLLPFSYAYKREGVLTEYGHNISYDAYKDFINNLPNGEGDYFSALGTFANTLYEKQCRNNELYFLDKTPRYYYIIPEILKAFPDAKFIFLFRNPIHVMSSIIETWLNGRLKTLYMFERDLNLGPKALSDGYSLLKDKAYALKYEDYVSNPEKYTKEICKYLELEYDSNLLSAFSSQNAKGKMGDETGVKEYNHISTKSLEKWKSTINTPFRKYLAKKYIMKTEQYIFDIQGYDKQNIIEEVSKIPISRYKLIDILDYTYAYLFRLLKINVFFGKTIKKWSRNRYFS